MTIGPPPAPYRRIVVCTVAALVAWELAIRVFFLLLPVGIGFAMLQSEIAIVSTGNMTIVDLLALIGSCAVVVVAIFKMKKIARALRRVLDAGVPLQGAADHGVSEAIYLADPDQNGLELYWDRPREEWPRSPDGAPAMYTDPLDLEDLLRSAE